MAAKQRKNNYNCFMAAKQEKRGILKYLLSILPTTVAAQPLNEEIRSQKFQPVLGLVKKLGLDRRQASLDCRQAGTVKNGR